MNGSHARCTYLQLKTQTAFSSMLSHRRINLRELSPGQFKAVTSNGREKYARRSPPAPSTTLVLWETIRLCAVQRPGIWTGVFLAEKLESEIACGRHILHSFVDASLAVARAMHLPSPCREESAEFLGRLRYIACCDGGRELWPCFVVQLTTRAELRDTLLARTATWLLASPSRGVSRRMGLDGRGPRRRHPVGSKA